LGYLFWVPEDEDENEDEGEDEDDQLNSDGDETEAGEMEGSEDTWESVDHSTPRAFSGPPSEKMIKATLFFQIFNFFLAPRS